MADGPLPFFNGSQTHAANTGLGQYFGHFSHHRHFFKS